MRVNPIKKRINNRGVTLVEVLVTLAVLSIMAVPIFDTFMESMRINHKTMTTVSANHIGQRVLEILKADGSIDGFTAHDSLADTYVGVMEGYDIQYTLTDITGLDYAPDASSNINYGTVVDYDVSDVEIKYYKKEDDGKSYFVYDSSDLETTWTKLVVEDATSAVKVTFYKMTKEADDSITETQFGSSKDISIGSNPLKVVVKVEGEPVKGRLDIENKSKEKVEVYEVDDKLGLLRTVPKIVANKGELELHRNARSESADDDNERKVYSVDVRISRNSEELEQLLGTIVK